MFVRNTRHQYVFIQTRKKNELVSPMDAATVCILQSTEVLLTQTNGGDYSFIARFSYGSLIGFFFCSYAYHPPSFILVVCSLHTNAMKSQFLFASMRKRIKSSCWSIARHTCLFSSTTFYMRFEKLLISSLSSPSQVECWCGMRA